MSSKRKLRRAQAQHVGAAPTARLPSRDALRKQTAAQRFAKAGSDKLWLGLLGWSEERRARIWLAQAVHDATIAGTDPVAELEARVPALAGKLAAEAAGNAVEVWRASGDGYDPSDPAPKWHQLANLSTKLGLGTTTAEELQEDWEAWITLPLAAPARAALMASLAQAEQAAVGLHSLTKSARMNALVNMSRAMWTALAYGDDATFDLLTETSERWLGLAATRAR